MAFIKRPRLRHFIKFSENKKGFFGYKEKAFYLCCFTWINSTISEP